METRKLDIELLGSLVSKVRRDQLFYSEYKFLTDEQLQLYFLNKEKSLIENSESYQIVAIEKRDFIGYLSCVKDHFDSEIFGFGCYRISNLQVFSNYQREIQSITSSLFQKLEGTLKQKERKFHVSIGLSNNMQDFDKIFNSLTGNGFYYYHTLLTFSSIKLKFNGDLGRNKGITIRTATKEDSEEISRIAAESFELSRFKLDPFLDDTKGNYLLGLSARNAVEKKFVDVVFVAEIDGRIAGYYTGKKRYIKEFDRTLGEGIISAIDSQYRGRGVFTVLNNTILNWLADNSDFTEMGTYLGNFPVHKSFIKKGLPLIRSTHQLSKLIGT